MSKNHSSRLSNPIVNNAEEKTRTSVFERLGHRRDNQHFQTYNPSTTAERSESKRESFSKISSNSRIVTEDKGDRLKPKTLLITTKSPIGECNTRDKGKDRSSGKERGEIIDKKDRGSGRSDKSSRKHSSKEKGELKERSKAKGSSVSSRSSSSSGERSTSTSSSSSGSISSSSGSVDTSNPSVELRDKRDKAKRGDERKGSHSKTRTSIKDKSSSSRMNKSSRGGEDEDRRRGDPYRRDFDREEFSRKRKLEGGNSSQSIPLKSRKLDSDTGANKYKTAPRRTPSPPPVGRRTSQEYNNRGKSRDRERSPQRRPSDSSRSHGTSKEKDYHFNNNDRYNTMRDGRPRDRFAPQNIPPAGAGPRRSSAGGKEPSKIKPLMDEFPDPRKLKHKSGEDSKRPRLSAPMIVKSKEELIEKYEEICKKSRVDLWVDQTVKGSGIADPPEIAKKVQEDRLRASSSPSSLRDELKSGGGSSAIGEKLFESKELEDLSEISDDDVEDILEDEEISDKSPLKNNLGASGLEMERVSTDELDLNNSVNHNNKTGGSISIGDRDLRSLQSQSQTDDDILDRMNCLEEISDEELGGEDGRGGFDLGVDWSSLVCREKSEEGSVASIVASARASLKERWNPLQILQQVGISRELCGEQLFQSIVDKIHESNQETDESDLTKDEIEKMLQKPILRRRRIEKKNMLETFGLGLSYYSTLLKSSFGQERYFKPPVKGIPTTPTAPDTPTSTTTATPNLRTQLVNRLSISKLLPN